MITKLQCELKESDEKRIKSANENVQKRTSKTEKIQKRKRKVMIRQIAAEKKLGHERYFEIVRNCCR